MDRHGRYLGIGGELGSRTAGARAKPLTSASLSHARQPDGALSMSVMLRLLPPKLRDHALPFSC